jgi:hypothetical protein
MTSVNSPMQPEEPSARIALAALIERIQAQLTPDLLDARWAALRGPGAHRFAGYCYVAAEALYHLSGGPRSGLKIYRCTYAGEKTHWWLQDAGGAVIDPTADQFVGAPPYHLGRRCGFLSRSPSRRTRVLIARVLMAKGPPLPNPPPIQSALGRPLSQPESPSPVISSGPADADPSPDEFAE